MARRESVDVPEWNPTKEELDLFEEWRNNTIQHLVNHKNGVQPHRLPAMLEERFDERIPIYKMGFRVWHINHFLYQMASDIEIRKNYENGRLYIFLVESSVPKHLLHIRQMVLGQRDDRDGALRYSLRRVSCIELLKNVRMPPVVDSKSINMPTTFQGAGQSYNANPWGVTRVLRDPGPNSIMRRQLVRLNSSAGVVDSRKGEQDWTLNHSMQRVSDNELLKNGRRAPQQAVGGLDVKKVATTLNKAGQSYNVGSGGTSSTNFNFGVRDQTNTMRSQNYKTGRLNSTKEELVRLNSSAGVANSCESEEDWDIPSTKTCSNNPGTLKVTYSRQPVPGLETISATVPKSTYLNSDDEFDGFGPRSVKCTKEKDDFPPPSTFTDYLYEYELGKASSLPSTSSGVGTVSDIQTFQARPSTTLSQNLKECQLFSEAVVEEFKASVTNPTAESKETGNAKNDKANIVGFSSLDINDLDMEIHYGYSIDSIDLDMGAPYSYQTTMLGNRIPPTTSFKPIIRFPPYLIGNSKSFKEYLQEIGELEKFIKSD